LLLNDHDAPFFIIPSYEHRFPMSEEHRVREENLTSLDLLIGRQEVFNELGELDLLASEDGQVNGLPDFELSSLDDLSLADITQTTEV
jgi:hypothetical protein